MEEFVTPYYGSFAILGEWVKEFTWCTGCSNWIADRTLWGQIFPNELKRERQGWTTTHKLEWGFFLLECLLHNVTYMKKKEHQRHFWRLQAEAAKETAPEHPSMQTFIVSLLKPFYKWLNKFTEWSRHWFPECFPIDSRIPVWGSYDKN